MSLGDNMKAYLDNNATTAMASEVLEAMQPYFRVVFHNPASVAGEALGLRDAIGKARRELGRLLGAPDTTSIVFTSGATESNNWAVVGVTDRVKQKGHVITSSIEHPSMLEAMRRLQEHGWSLTILPASSDGLVRPDILANAMREDTVFVSIMAANNETGVIQPIAELAKVAKEQNPSVFFHTDATQAVGKWAISLADGFRDVDLLSLSAHKFHGPKGCGALFIREGNELEPLFVGGGQEEGRRSGTTNVPSVVGLGRAASEARGHLHSMAEVSMQRDTFEHDLLEAFPDAVIHGVGVPRLPNTSCFSLPKANGNALAEDLASLGIFVGTGSACSAGALHPPRTLLAMGVDYQLAMGAIRVSLSRYTEPSEIRCLLEELPGVRNRASASCQQSGYVVGRHG